MDQVKFVDLSGSALGRSYPFKFSKDCLPQVLLDPFLNTLAQISQKSRGLEPPFQAPWFLRAF